MLLQCSVLKHVCSLEAGSPGWSGSYRVPVLHRCRLCIQAVYGVLKEAEHRSTFYIPYWNLPFAKNLVPRQHKFYADLAVINSCLDDLIAQAKNTRQTDDAEALQARDYSKVRNKLPCST